MLPPSQPIRRSEPPRTVPIGCVPDSISRDVISTEPIDSAQKYTYLPHRDFEDARFWQEVRAYASIPNTARERYAGQFVAVYNGNIVDSDPDETTLIDRFYRTFGYVPVLIHAVGVEDNIVDFLD